MIGKMRKRRHIRFRSPKTLVRISDVIHLPGEGFHWKTKGTCVNKKFLDTYPQPFQLTQIAGNWKLPNSSKKVLDIGNIVNLAPTIFNDINYHQDDTCVNWALSYVQKTTFHLRERTTARGRVRLPLRKSITFLPLLLTINLFPLKRT